MRLTYGDVCKVPGSADLWRVVCIMDLSGQEKFYTVINRTSGKIRTVTEKELIENAMRGGDAKRAD